MDDTFSNTTCDTRPNIAQDGFQVIDIGLNLAADAFRRDRDEVVDRALAAGVGQMIVTGTSEAVSRRAAALADQRPGVLYATAGVHPHDARHWNEATATALADLAARTGVVAIGEAGLDFFRDYSPRPDQERAFEAQLELAAHLQLPAFLHERDACDRFAAILSRWRHRLPGAVVHCFTGSGEALAAYRDLDVYLGITGWICDERRGLHLRQLVREIPPERLLIETDAPFLLPRDLKPRPRGGRNEPAFLPHVLRAVAHCLERPAREVAAGTTANARRLFALGPAPLSSPPLSDQEPAP